MTSCIRPIIWPANLADIHLEERQKNTLEEVINGEALGKERRVLRCSDEDFSLRRYYSFYGGNYLSRRVVFSNDRAFVVLGNHGDMPSFYEDKYSSHKIQYVWECYSGSFWLKKRLCTPVELGPLKAFAKAPSVGLSQLGLSELAADPTGECRLDGRGKSKLRYFEKQAPYTLAEGLEKFGRTPHVKCLVGLIDAVRKIHLQKGEADGLTAYFIKKEKKVQRPFSLNLSYTLFHANISPDSIFCEEFVDEVTGEIYPRFILSGFGRLGNLHAHNAPKRGWNSPEYVSYHVDKKYLHVHDGCFSVDYGVKRDTWTLGLLLGYFFLGRYKDCCLPNFNFIVNKVKFDESGKWVIDESGLAKITQEEINLEIDEIIKGLPSQDSKVFWEFIRGCLIVDPDLRPAIAEHYLTLESLEGLSCPVIRC